MIKLILKILSVISFFVIFGYLFLDDFRDFKSYSSENLETSEVRIAENIQVFSTPNTEIIEKIVKLIDNSEKYIYFNVYLFTENRTKEALLKAKKRGIDIKIILEKNPYKSPNLNNKHFNELEKNGIEMKWSLGNNYDLNHAKYMIIDDEIIWISTGNMSYSTFSQNKDFFVFSENLEVIQSLKKLFENDFKIGKNKISEISENLIISPETSFGSLKKLVSQSEKSIYIYFQYLYENEILEEIIKKAENGVSVKIILDKNSEDSEIVEKLKNYGIEIKFRNKQHSKVIIVDEKIAFIGSQNFSDGGLKENREVGIIFGDLEEIEKLVKEFFNDFEKANF